MTFISVFDIFKPGIGPSSSHTMGPWRAAQAFLEELRIKFPNEPPAHIVVELYGSLAKTGKGHGTDIAVTLGLAGHDPVTIPTDTVLTEVQRIRQEKFIIIGGNKISFDPKYDILFYYDQILEGHANGMIFRAFFSNGNGISSEYYSVGGGFILKAGIDSDTRNEREVPFPIEKASDINKWCKLNDLSMLDIIWKNELTFRTREEIRSGLLTIWKYMRDCIFTSCRKSGALPGGLGVMRRAGKMAKNLLPEKWVDDPELWINQIRNSPKGFEHSIKWISCFALAVNEENADFGRIVTAPTNGAAGVVPAVLMYLICFDEKFKGDDDIIKFLLIAGEIGSLFKKGATISAAMGGCQAEIGVSSAMAAGALAACMGADTGQILMAAEIAMEHHLGMTCDPIGGLVQVPCIERNTMGAIKAITAAQLAIESDPAHAKVSLDEVIKTMKDTANDMHHKYKETADGGLAVNISVNIVEC